MTVRTVERVIVESANRLAGAGVKGYVSFFIGARERRRASSQTKERS
jgi:hypothetical protein